MTRRGWASCPCPRCPGVGTEASGQVSVRLTDLPAGAKRFHQPRGGLLQFAFSLPALRSVTHGRAIVVLHDGP